MEKYQNNLSYAEKLDKNDLLLACRNEFYIPKIKDKEVFYFCGNSLGLQPKGVKHALLEEQEKWQFEGVEGHFSGQYPWLSYHKDLAIMTAPIVGALPDEIVIMNSLTVNIHLMLVSFYRPKGKRTKILVEDNLFPSDLFALQSFVKFKGLNPDEIIVKLHSKDLIIDQQYITDTIEQLADELALVFLGGVNYLSGQVLDMQHITKAAHKVGALAGYDLAHATGNIKMNLHEWQVDFAMWCSYKYLNAGPGAVAGVFIHQNHHRLYNEFDRLQGWWGTNEATRFEMLPHFDPALGADAWQLSNAPIFSMAAYRASINLFNKIDLELLFAKSKQLTDYLAWLIEVTFNKTTIEIITPENQRGCQLSLKVYNTDKNSVEKLKQKGLIVDWRYINPTTGIIRMSPVPLYNCFVDVYKAVQILKEELHESI